MTSAAPISASQQRFNNILARIQKTERGNQMCYWLQGWDIEVKFSQDLDGPAAYFGHNENLPKDNKKPGGTLYLDQQAPDEFIIIGMFEEMRKAWHDKVARSDAPNRSPLCHIISRRFEEADALSYAACMVIEYSQATGDPRVFAAMANYERYRPFINTLSILTRYAEENSFNRMRRAAFDTYFEAFMPDMAKAEGAYIANFLELMRGPALEAEQRYIKSLYSEVDTTEPIVDRFDTISTQDFAYYGMPGFAKDGENYLTAFKNLPPVNSPVYMLPTQPGYTALQEFAEKHKMSLPHMNLLGSPYKLTDQDKGFLQSMAPQKPANTDEAQAPAQKQGKATKKTKRKKMRR